MNCSLLSTLLVIGTLAATIYADEPSSPPTTAPALQAALLQAQQRAQTHQLTIIQGNGKRATMCWTIPMHVQYIKAEGGPSTIQSDDRAEKYFEVVADENLLGYFVAYTEGNTFVVKPQEGFVLISHTPVQLCLLLPNGTVPPLSMQRSDRVISVAI